MMKRDVKFVRKRLQWRGMEICGRMGWHYDGHKAIEARSAGGEAYVARDSTISVKGFGMELFPFSATFPACCGERSMRHACED